jgi:hypothetical protein
MPAFGLLGIDFGHGFDAFEHYHRGWNPFHYWTTILKFAKDFQILKL